MTPQMVDDSMEHYVTLQDTLKGASLYALYEQIKYLLIRDEDIERLLSLEGVGRYLLALLVTQPEERADSDWWWRTCRCGRIYRDSPQHPGTLECGSCLSATRSIVMSISMIQTPLTPAVPVVSAVTTTTTTTTTATTTTTTLLRSS
jgi:hypothetical protein